MAAGTEDDGGKGAVHLVYLDGDEFNKAITAINKGLSKGGIKRPDQARLEELGLRCCNKYRTQSDMTPDSV